MLMKINFLMEFGKNKKLLVFYEQFKSGKFRYSKNHKDETKAKRVGALLKIWDIIPNESLSLKEQIQEELEILGFIQTKFDVSPKMLYVLNLDTTWSPRLLVHGLRSGKTSEVRISKRYYNTITKKSKEPLVPGDFVIWKNIEKKPAVRKDGDEWIEIPDKYNYWMNDYNILDKDEK